MGHRRHTAIAAAALITTLGLTACSGGRAESQDDGQTAPEAAQAPSGSADQPVDSPAAEQGDGAAAPADDDAAAGGAVPAWAKEPTSGGEEIASIDAGDVNVKVFQMGVEKAPKEGRWVDPDTKKPLIAKGDDIVFVNYVVTNNGDPIDLGSSLVKVTPKYDDWKYAQGMGGITDSSLSKKVGIETSAIANRADPTVYPFAKGEHFSYGENFHYQKNSPITFKVSITPVDDAGKLVHAERTEQEGKGTIA